jgi:hypothetical protein
MAKEDFNQVSSSFEAVQCILSYFISSGPQQCVRKHFPLLSCLSQRKITLLTHRWELLQRQPQQQKYKYLYKLVVLYVFMI